MWLPGWSSTSFPGWASSLPPRRHRLARSSRLAPAVIAAARAVAPAIKAANDEDIKLITAIHADVALRPGAWQAHPLLPPAALPGRLRDHGSSLWVLPLVLVSACALTWLRPVCQLRWLAALPLLAACRLNRRSVDMTSCRHC